MPNDPWWKVAPGNGWTCLWTIFPRVATMAVTLSDPRLDLDTVDIMIERTFFAVITTNYAVISMLMTIRMKTTVEIIRTEDSFMSSQLTAIPTNVNFKHHWSMLLFYVFVTECRYMTRSLTSNLNILRRIPRFMQCMSSQMEEVAYYFYVLCFSWCVCMWQYRHAVLNIWRKVH
jgi:hypothetical protein